VFRDYSIAILNLHVKHHLMGSCSVFHATLQTVCMVETFEKQPLNLLLF